MKFAFAGLAALAAFTSTAPAMAQAVTLDKDALAYEIVHNDGRKAYLAKDAQDRPITEIVRLPDGGVMPPHKGGGGLKILTVVQGDLSWGDGMEVDPAKERVLAPGSVVVIPAEGGAHWKAARSGDVLFQVVFVRDGALMEQVAAQTGF
jgi:quercetin dioxygenase-like cupin family protein